MTETIPQVFVPYDLRNRLLYRNLSRHSFSQVEKTFIGSESAGLSSLLAWPEEKFTVLSRITKRYSLAVTTVRDWMNKVDMSLPITNKIGRPRAMDDIAVEKFQDTLETRRAAKNAVPLAETLSLLGAGVTDTHMRLGKRGAAAVSNICVTIQKKLFRELNVVKVKPQILTDARLKALRCPRISYVWGCVCMAYSANLRGENKWNADATTIIVSESGTGSLVCIIKDKDNYEPVASSSLPNNLNLLIKWFALNNAGGEAGPLVLMIAVPTMEENTFFATQVLSTGSTTATGERGWLYFSRTRGGCSSMWVHYYLNVTLPTIKLSNDGHKHKVRYVHSVMLFTAVINTEQI
jgi:hypothetical protein